MTEIILNAAALRVAIETVRHAAATAPERPILMTVVLEVDEAGARCVAADNYRIAVSADVPVIAGELRGTFPVRLEEVPALLAFLKRLAKDATVHVRTVEGRPGIDFDAGQAGVFTASLVHGAFPRYQQVWPRDSEQVVVLDARYLAKLAAIAPKGSGGMRVYLARENAATSPVLFEGTAGREVVMPIKTA